jgi:hypothetical protein
MDAGNFAGDTSEAGRRNTQTLLDAMGRLGYAVANLGEREVLFGMPQIQEWAKAASVPLLSTNLVFQDTGKPAFTPTMVKTVTAGPGSKKKLRVGLLGLARMNPGLSTATPDGRRIVTLDPATAARSVLADLRKKSDVVVALVTLEPDQTRDLAKQVPGIDLFLGAFGPVQVQEDLPVPASPETKRTLPARLAYVGNQGKKLGEIRIFVSEEGTLARADAALVNLGKAVPDDPGIMDLVEKNRIAINEIHKKEAPLVDAAAMRSSYSGRSYVKSSACKDCHAEEFRLWEESRHAHAFSILEEKHQDYNPECVGCHTTGFRRPTGYVNAKSTPDLMNVQCEACHGPGNDHPEKVGEGYGKVTGEFCVTCHTPDNSPDFDPVAYRLKIRHWQEKGSTPEAAAAR